MRSVLLSLLLYSVCYAAFDEYKAKRAKLLRDEELLSIGGKIDLTDKEAILNNCLMKHKFKEVDYGFDNPHNYNFSHHFFNYKDDIKKSKVYRIIKDMPKGAALHIHDMGILGPDYMLNLTYMENLYVCFTKNDVKLQFSNKVPKSPCAKWELISQARESSNNITKFDSDLRSYFTMYVENPDKIYPSIQESWDTFMKYFGRVIPLLTYRPVWDKYFYDVLKQFREDNIMYIEIRSILPNLYELDGTIYSPLITAKTYKKTIKRFVKDYPDFIGAKLIYAPSRMCDRNKLSEYLEIARTIKANMPEFLAGFDLVGREEIGSPLIEFIPQLLNASTEFNYFFHAGETDWSGTLIDENLIDAILLGSKRIGHAYALPKHPLLMKKVVENDIALEVNVISNAVLSLVKDIRNHPLSLFISQGVPVVLSSDDPGIWEADSLSDDFYVAFVGVVSRLYDLRLLKQLAINSLKYSSLSSNKREDALHKFNERWDDFINNFNCNKY